MQKILEKDTSVQFPHLTVLKASAGSGKTYTLTARIAQFLLSEKIPKNKLRNLLAITFSNNAAKEMKEQTLKWLKGVYFGDPEQVATLSQIVSLDPGEMRERAGRLVDEILENYIDFQIKTIDSFMATVFRSSVIDFGYNPDFEIVMDNTSLMEYSFNLFLRNVREGTPEAADLEKLVDAVLDQAKEDASYLWNPSSVLLEETKKIYRKLSGAGKEVRIVDYRRDLDRIKERIRSCAETLEREIGSSKLTRSRNSAFTDALSQIRGGNFQDLVGKQFKNIPVLKPSAGKQAAFDRIQGLFEEFRNLSSELTVLSCRSRCAPFLETFLAFRKIVESAKREQSKIFIEDINSHLAQFLNSAVVPDIYFRIGDVIFHFLIDEFQDTSPVQWSNLFPLIENSLSQGGSLFIVGDTKQSIYGFRNADYTIMKSLERFNPFPSADHSVRQLDINYRSRKKVLEFNDRVFKEILAASTEYRPAGEKSGLTDYIQKPQDRSADDGFVQLSFFERSDDSPLEKRRVQELIGELRDRGYRFRDIAILTQNNEHAVRVTSWLNEKEIPFISYSSLDIRRRRVTGEIMAMMRFLNSPNDDFSFGTLLLGDIFARAIRKTAPGPSLEELRRFCFSRRGDPPLYKAFQQQFSALWERYFAELFRLSGFLPIYDLTTELFAVFKIFENMPEEEAALIKFLEAVKNFEGGGYHSLSDFLSEASESAKGEGKWDMAVPKNLEAVKVMTIHKAKGLGFPVVIVLLYEVKNKSLDYILEERADGASLLKINQSEAACDPSLQALYDAERMRDTVNKLNTLYVGFTRPQRELYVVGVTGNRQGYPFSLLPDPASAPPEKPQPPPEAPTQRTPVGHTRPQHRSRRLDLSRASADSFSVQERRRGEFIHRVLSLIDYVGNEFEPTLRGMIRSVKSATRCDYREDEITGLILALVHQERIGSYFEMAPGREIKNEQEYCNGVGRLFRMDRVVVDPEKIMVIDYKTGMDEEAIDGHRRQLSDYAALLREIYPDRLVSGLLAYIDSNEVKEVR